MATAILRSHDLLPRYHFDSQTTTSFPFRSGRNPNPNPNTIRPRRRKRSPVAFNGGDRNRVRDRTMVVKFPSNNLVMGQVKILKRGEDLDRAFGDGDDDDDDLVLSSTDRLGPDPETVQKQIRVSDLKVVDGLYAGSAAFFASPPPSSLPFPAFFAKKEKNDVATSDLRRLLRLDDC